MLRESLDMTYFLQLLGKDSTMEERYMQDPLNHSQRNVFTKIVNGF